MRGQTPERIVSHTRGFAVGVRYSQRIATSIPRVGGTNTKAVRNAYGIREGVKLDCLHLAKLVGQRYGNAKLIVAPTLGVAPRIFDRAGVALRIVREVRRLL